MPVTVIAGGQFGSEGKGKVAYLLAQRERAVLSLRVGGPNSGHTAIHGRRTYKLRVLPTPALLPSGDIALPAGSYLHLPTLWQEVEATGLDLDRLYVDPNALIVTAEHIAAERERKALADIGSTKSGTGEAVAARVRRADALRAEQVPELKHHLADTVATCRSHLARGDRILVEGTQGFGLSVLHWKDYPLVTSRDTTAAGFVSEAGLSPRDVDEIVLVLRAFPIRVAGPSGPLPREVDWATVSKIAGEEVREYTTVTNQLRRVALFDPEVVRRAIAVNQPTRIVLNHVDYFDREAGAAGVLSPRARRMVTEIAGQIGAPLHYLGLGPDRLAEIHELL